MGYWALDETERRNLKKKKGGVAILYKNKKFLKVLLLLLPLSLFLIELLLARLGDKTVRARVGETYGRVSKRNQNKKGKSEIEIRTNLL